MTNKLNGTGYSIGSWKHVVTLRGMEVIGDNATYGGAALSVRYKGQVLSKWAKTDAEALAYLMQRADEIDAQEK